MKDFLQVINLHYGCFDNFNMSLKKQRFVSIIGSNMCGKTTLLKIIAGIIPTNDVVKLEDVSLNKHTVNNYVKQIGVVFSCKKDVFLNDRVIDELSYSLSNLNYTNFYIKRRITAILNTFSLDLDIKEKKISELSHIEKQKILFCIALLHKPKLLLIDDDVFTDIDDKESLKIIKILKKIDGLMTISFKSNLINATKSDYIYILNNNEIIARGTYKEIIANIPLLQSIGLEVPLIDFFKSKLSNEELVKLDLISGDKDGN